MTNIPVRRGITKAKTQKTVNAAPKDKTVGELADNLDGDEPILPTYSKEDDLLQDATKNLEEPFFEEESQKKKKHHAKKFFIVLLVLVLLGGAGAGGWYLVVKKKIFAKKDSTGQPAASVTAKQAASAAPTAAVDVKPVNVAYAFKATDKDPYTLYYRPAAGGDRVEAMKLPKDFTIYYHDTVKSNVVFGSDNAVYASADSGKTYAKIYETTGGGAITSLKLSSEGTRLAIGVVPNFGDNVKGKAISVDLKGKDSKDLFDADKYAIYTIGWSEAKQQFAYAEGCYGCDGGRSAFKLRDLKTKKATDLVPGGDIKTLGYAQAVSDDLTKLIYIESTYDAAIKTEGPPGYYSAAPYKVQLLDFKTSKVSLLATIGAKNEKNANGTEKIRQFYLGFAAGSSGTAYYAEGSEVHLAAGDKVSTILTTSQPVLGMHYVGNAEIISSYGKDTSDFTLSNYTIASKKDTKIFSGDNNTVVLGVTTN